MITSSMSIKQTRISTNNFKFLTLALNISSFISFHISFRSIILDSFCIPEISWVIKFIKVLDLVKRCIDG
jgi:hypothetical protein